MESLALYMEFNKEVHQANHPVRYGVNADAYKWTDNGIDSAKVLSQNMLVKEILSKTTETGPKTFKRLSVYLCYNWKTKTEFILMRSAVEETYSYYTPQYGRDDNYQTSRRGDYQFLAFSVEAFKRDIPDLARCLDTV